MDHNNPDVCKFCCADSRAEPISGPCRKCRESKDQHTIKSMLVIVVVGVCTILFIMSTFHK